MIHTHDTTAAFPAQKVLNAHDSSKPWVTNLAACRSPAMMGLWRLWETTLLTVCTATILISLDIGVCVCKADVLMWPPCRKPSMKICK